MFVRVILMAFCLIPLYMQAQFAVTVQVPPPGLVHQNQLWNIALVNNSNTQREVSILLDLQDVTTGQPALSAVTGNILVGKGIKMITFKDIQPIQYTYGTPLLSGGFLPMGTYTACYTIVASIGEKGEPMTNECVRLNVVPLSPPLLITPLNNTVSINPNPLLSWMPPAPLIMFDKLYYDVVVAEVLSGQSPGEAVLYNMPVYTRSSLNSNYLQYPTGSQHLDTGKLYAWQVIAKNSIGNSIASETWSFSIAKDSMAVNVRAVNHIILDRSSVYAGITVVSDNILPLKFYSLTQQDAVFRLTDQQGKEIQTFRHPLQYGDNYLDIPLNRQFARNKIYQISIIDNQQQYTASFTLK